MKTTADFTSAELRRQKDLPRVRIPLTRPPDWQNYAACHGEWDLFFPLDATGNGRSDSHSWATSGIPLAKVLCDGCPVFEECRKSGEREVFGLWAGVNRGHGVKDPTTTARSNIQTPAEKESRPPRSGRSRPWADMSEEQREQARARARAYKARRRLQAEPSQPRPRVVKPVRPRKAARSPEERRAAQLEASRRYRERLRSDPERYQAYLARRNQAYREQCELMTSKEKVS